MLEAWVQVTSLVLGESSGFSDSGVSLGLVVGGTVHHFRVRFFCLAMATQEAMFASWSRLETTSSSPGEKLMAMDRLRKSWVVEPPITGQRSVFSCNIMSAGKRHTNFIILGVDVLGASYKAVAEMLG